VELSDDREKLSMARRWLPIATAGGWLLTIGLLGWMVTWWLAITAVVMCGALMAPALLREVDRGRRLHEITMSEPTAAQAAWRELLDEAADRGMPIPEEQTVRESARQLATDHRLDDDGKRHLGAVIEVMERSWYGTGDTIEPAFAAEVEGVRQSLQRTAPLSWQGRAFPRSALQSSRERVRRFSRVPLPVRPS
ncbi:MAG: DUF4129 domain-containing protein, partial [Haloechinothrix sp.]